MLTPEGIAAAEALAGRLASAEPRPAVVLSSPLVRTRQTAAILGDALGARVLVDTRLAPGATAPGLLAALGGLTGPVVTVGHQPDCSAIVAELTGQAVVFPPAGSYAIELDLPDAAA